MLNIQSTVNSKGKRKRREVNAYKGNKRNGELLKRTEVEKELKRAQT